jgi:uncharacterized LabA/DUF88 family protein
LRAAIFIDGGYFVNRLKDDRGSPDDVDYNRLTEYLLAPLRMELPIDLMRCYFYDCPPWMPDEPNESATRRMESHRLYIEGIERTDRWQVKFGKLERRWDGNQEYFEQKRVDVMLSVDLVRHSAAGHIQHAILLAGDSDFIPAVAAAKESGVTVSLWGGAPKTIHRDLGFIADQVHFFDWRAFTKRPAAQAPASGGGRGPRRPVARKPDGPPARNAPRPRPPRSRP